MANGSLEELRAGVRARLASEDNSPHPDNETLTLEQIFLSVVGTTETSPHPEGELAWLS